MPRLDSENFDAFALKLLALIPPQYVGKDFVQMEISFTKKKTKIVLKGDKEIELPEKTGATICEHVKNIAIEHVPHRTPFRSALIGGNAIWFQGPLHFWMSPPGAKPIPVGMMNMSSALIAHRDSLLAAARKLDIEGYVLLRKGTSIGDNSEPRANPLDDPAETNAIGAAVIHELVESADESANFVQKFFQMLLVEGLDQDAVHVSLERHTHNMACIAVYIADRVLASECFSI